MHIHEQLFSGKLASSKNKKTEDRQDWILLLLEAY